MNEKVKLEIKERAARIGNSPHFAEGTMESLGDLWKK